MRRSTEGRRYASAQRSGRIDPNPHQIDAAIFALGRVHDGGCILADEVGLGKTIEAGLVVAQLCTEGARRILLVAPKSLLGQWQSELLTLFGISAVLVDAQSRELSGSGVFLIGRDLLGSEQGVLRLGASGPFDLCVVDEAHEVFSGIYRRFDRAGNYLGGAPQAKMAGRLRQLLGGQTPVLLLTATPLQNSLAELWGLVQYVDRSGTLLGDLPTFRQTFCADDDRSLVAAREADLQRRLATVVRRTLRRQAQEFMRVPFVGRHARLFEYEMSAPERALYEDVTRYLLTPGIAAFRGQHRRLVVLGFHRRMASSHRALAASLDRVARRLRDILRGADDDPAPELLADLEEEDALTPSDMEEGEPPPAAHVAAELELVESFVRRLAALGTDAKARALLEAVEILEQEAASGQRSDKLVIFTESLATQEYLRDLLLGAGLPDESITLFRGQNESSRAAAALERWQAEVGSKPPVHARPSRELALRLSLVHEFEHRSRVFIATEAGAKGLNLQFCDTVVNYDLPWNPQRIEQRIGRCHRYGQKRDVTVINFIARDNAADRLTFEILSRKLDLFGTVLDASDHVLYEPGGAPSDAVLETLSAGFAAELRRIYESARSLAQIETELSRLGSWMDGQRREAEAAHERAAGLIESRFDAAVRRSFRYIADELPRHLLALDRDLDRLLCGYLESEHVPYARSVTGDGIAIDIAPAAALPAPFHDGVRVWVGGGGSAHAETLHTGHPLVRLAADAARRASGERFRVRFTTDAAELSALAGRRGRLRVMKVSYPGYEPVDRLVPVTVFEGGETLEPATALRLLEGPLVAAPDLTTGVEESSLEDAEEEAIFLDEREVAAPEHAHFERSIAQLERFIEDRVLILERSRAEWLERVRGLQRDRTRASGAEVRSRVEAELQAADREVEVLDAQLRELRARNDAGYQRWREQAYARRYAPPRREVVLDVEFVIG